jgi:hypothetical protein
MIHEEICTYEVCKLAKEKGFPQDECGVNIGYYAWDGLRKIHSLVNSFAWYNEEYVPDNLYLAPTQSLLQRWLREEKNIDIAIVPLYTGGYSYIVYNIHYRDNRVVNTNAGYDTYELALEDALKYTLKNLV